MTIRKNPYYSLFLRKNLPALDEKNVRRAELDEYYYGARYYIPRESVWLSVDPLAELAPNMSPYRYAFNNPTNFVDPYGLFETRKEARQYRREHGIDGKIHKAKDGTFSIDDYRNSVSYSRSLDTNEVEQAILVVGNKSALPGYINRAYRNAVSSGQYGRYSPYRNDAFSISYTVSARGVGVEGGFSIGVAVGNGDAALVVGAGGSVGVKPEIPGLKTGFQLAIHDNYGGNNDVLAGLAGTDIGYEGSLLLGGAYSVSAVNKDGKLVKDELGVRTTGINAGIGFGAGATVSQAESYKLSNGIRRIGSWFTKK